MLLWFGEEHLQSGERPVSMGGRQGMLTVAGRLATAFARRMRGLKLRVRCLIQGGRVATSVAVSVSRGAVVNVGRRVTVRRYGSVFLEGQAVFDIGDDAAIMQGGEVVVGQGAHLVIGSQVYLGAYCNIRCSGSIDIGEGARIGQFASILDASYELADRDTTFGKLRASAVTIGRGAWISAHAVILPGVSIGDGAVIGGGSVMSKSVPAYAIAAGNPARLVRYRGR